MVNKVFLSGRLGKDPVVNTTKSEQKVCRFSLATTEKRPGRDGAPAVEHTEWHNIIVWGRQAESCGKYLKKGRRVIVEGKIATSEWQKDDGTKMRSTEIVANTVHFLDSAKEAAAIQEAAAPLPKKSPGEYADLNSIPF